MKYAKMGDLRPLAERVRDGEILTDEERIFIADYLLGKAEMKLAPLLKELKDNEREDIYRFVHVSQAISGGSKEAAVVEAQAHFGLCRRTIFNAMRAVNQRPERQRTFHTSLEAYAARINDRSER